jgi:hypothetical protein
VEQPTAGGDDVSPPAAGPDEGVPLLDERGVCRLEHDLLGSGGLGNLV